MSSRADSSHNSIRDKQKMQQARLFWRLLAIFGYMWSDCQMFLTAKGGIQSVSSFNYQTDNWHPLERFNEGN